MSVSIEKRFRRKERFLTSPSTGLQCAFIVTVYDIIYDIVASYIGSELSQFKGFIMEEAEVNFISSVFPRFFL